MNPDDRIWMHDRLWKIFVRAMAYADLLEAAGNCDKAEEVRRECAAVSLHRDLDRILKGETQ